MVKGMASYLGLSIFAERTFMALRVGLVDVQNLLEGIAGVAVHDDGNVSAVPADVDVLLPLGICAAVGAGTQASRLEYSMLSFVSLCLNSSRPMGQGKLFKQVQQKDERKRHPAIVVADEATDIGIIFLIIFKILSGNRDKK